VRHPRQTLLGASRRVVLPGAHWQPWRLSWWMALGYLFGSAVFLGGMGGAKLSLVGTRAASWWYLSAACLFVLANYCSLISTVNGSDDLTEANLRSFRWIGWEPRQLPYLLTLAYLVGSLLFLAHAVVRLTGKAMPDHSLVALSLTLTGSVIFLCGFAVEVREVRRRHVWWDPRNLEWWRAALSFVGCAGFVCGAATGLIKHLLRMSWLSPVSGGAFFAGILLFLVSSYLILPELSG
jgi:hypothetical protein